MSTKIQEVGGASTVATNPSLATTIAATGSGNALIVVAYINSGGTASISGAGGTWAAVLADTINKVYAWINTNPTAGSTSVTVGSSVNSHFTVFATERSGLKASGLTFASAVLNGTALTAWSSNTVSNTVPVFSLAICQQGGGGTDTSTAGTGYAATSGTGISTSTVLNGSEGDTLAVHAGEFAAGTLQGLGTWAVATNCEIYVIGVELAPAANGPYYPLETSLYA